MLWTVLLGMLFVNANCIRVGIISDVAIVGTGTYLVTNGTEDECICTLITSNGSISGLNSFQGNGTCQFFSNYSTSSQIQISLNTSFIFLNLPEVILQVLTTTEQLGESILLWETSLFSVER